MSHQSPRPAGHWRHNLLPAGGLLQNYAIQTPVTDGDASATRPPKPEEGWRSGLLRLRSRRCVVVLFRRQRAVAIRRRRAACRRSRPAGRCRATPVHRSRRSRRSMREGPKPPGLPRPRARYCSPVENWIKTRESPFRTQISWTAKPSRFRFSRDACGSPSSRCSDFEG